MCNVFVYVRREYAHGHPFCPQNHRDTFPMRQDLLNKYEIKQFPKEFQHKIPHLLFLAVTKAPFVDMDKFLSINYPNNTEYCNKILNKININPPSKRKRKEHHDLHATLFGVQFTPTIDDDAFLTLVHEVAVIDEHYLTQFNDLIISSIYGQKYDFQMDLWQHNHWDRAIKLLQLYNNNVTVMQYVQVLSMLNWSVYGLKKILQMYLFECIKLPFKQKLNAMLSETDKLDIQVSADANKIEELGDLLKACAHACTSLQHQFNHDLQIQREWRKYKRSQTAKNCAQKKKKNKNKIEIDDSDEEKEANENKEEPRAHTTISKATIERAHALVVTIVEHIREVKKESPVLDEIRDVNFKSKPLGKLFYL